jgi:hypothetical protein
MALKLLILKSLCSHSFYKKLPENCEFFKISKMKVFLTAVILIVTLNLPALAQTKIYKGNSTSYSECMHTISENKIYRGNSSSYSDCLFTINGKKVFQGNSTSYSDCVVAIDSLIKYAVLACIIGPYLFKNSGNFPDNIENLFCRNQMLKPVFEGSSSKYISNAEISVLFSA